MELKEYLQIIVRYQKIFLTTWGLILLLSLFTVFVQPNIYEGEQTILITRDNKQDMASTSGQYDYYYQLESNGRFANIIVKSLKDKALVNKIFNNTALNPHEKIQKIAISKKEEEWILGHLKGEVLGNGYIKIKIDSHNRDLVKQTSVRLMQQLDNLMSKVGVDQNRIVKLKSEPVVITEKNKLYLPIGLSAFFGGLLLAIFSVLSINYWQEK